MEDLFNRVKEYGSIVRTNKLHGLDSWNEMKALLPKNSCNGLTWSINLVKVNGESLPSIGEAYTYVHDPKQLGMLGENDKTEKSNPNWEKFHFFLQLVRIPHKNPNCDLERLCQIAYNLGQLSAVYNEDSVYTPAVKRFYDMNNLGAMRTYTQNSCTISVEDVQKISELVESKKTGAGYLHKYLKYKKKYLQLKK